MHPTTMTLTDLLLLALSAQLNARRGELDRLQFGDIKIEIELKDNAPTLLRVMVEEKMTKAAILAQCAALLTSN